MVKRIMFEETVVINLVRINARKGLKLLIMLTIVDFFGGETSLVSDGEK